MSEERYNEIQDFLDGKFTDAKAEEFRNAISKNEQLAGDVAFLRLEREMQDALLDDEFSAQMKEWQKEKDALPDLPPDDSHNKKNGNNRYWLLLLLPLLVAGAWLFLKPTPREGQVVAPSKGANETTLPPTQQEPTTPPVEDIDEQPGTTSPNNQQDQDTPSKLDRPIAQTVPSDAELLALIDEHDLKMGYVPQSARGGSAKLLAEAESARNAGRYNEAISIYKKVAEEKSDEGIGAAMNLGLLYFNLKKYGEAVPYFKKASESAYADDVQYYLALCYVADRKFGEAAVLVDDLLKRDGFVKDTDREKAERLAKELGLIK